MMSAGFVPVPQRKFKSLVDQLHGWYEKAHVAEGEP